MSTSERGAVVQVDGVDVEQVEEPATAADLQDVVRAANQDGQAIVVTGGGTRLNFGNVGGPFDLALSTRGLNRIITHEPQDLTLAVEPGCTIQQINDALMAEGQHLPIDVAHPDRATIGGSYATGLGGPQRFSNGSLKDLVLGVEVVNQYGTIAKAGGMVVKNVTGFDLVHLHYGSLGAFGIVSRLNLRVSPRPPCTREYVAQFSSYSGAHRAGVALLEARVELMALYILWDRAEGWSLRFWLSGSQETVDGQGDRLIGLVRDAGQPSSEGSTDVADSSLPSFARFFDISAGSGIARYSVPASRQTEYLEAFEAMELQAVCSDLGSGLIYVVAEPSVEWRGRMIESDEPVFLSIPPELKREIDVFGGLPDSGAGIVRSLKSQYDPIGMFNRGRFVLGL